MSWMTCFSYIAVTTPTNYKTLRVTILEVLLAIGMLSIEIKAEILNFNFYEFKCA
jgi:hypothetical protein